MITIQEELLIFVMAVIAGAVVRLFYRAITIFRKIFKHKLWVINLEDLVFWLVISVYLFVQIYHTSNGSIRWYFVLGVVVGVVGISAFIQKIEKALKKIYVSEKEKNREELAKKSKKRYDIYTKGE
ncbi:MAG: spore cortex biosynthesis protein YabQ [Dorea sp.]